MHRKLPPLNALKAFEAAARTGGYVAAGRELGVTPAAVSQQVKNLERYFGKNLFVRHNNRLSLTDAGLAVFAESAEALERLAGMTARALDSNVRSRLVISVVPSLADRWLNRWISEFVRRNPVIRLDIRVEDDPVDFARYNIDVRICYGHHLYPDMASAILVHDEVLPLCTQAVAKGYAIDPADLDSLADDLLIHTSWGPSFLSHPMWADWFACAGSKRVPDAGRGHRAGRSSLAIDLALANVGVALAQRLLAQDEIADGRLQVPFARSVPLGHPYCAVYPHAKLHKRGVAAFVELVGEIARTRAA